MLAAERELDQARRSAPDHGDREAWPAWQRAATDAWLVRHPADGWVLRPAPGHRPTVEEIRRRGERLMGAMDGVRSSWRLERDSPERTEMEAQVGFLHEQMAGLYGPIFEALERLRADGAGGSADDLETVVRFLEADIYCFRSGYATADAIRAVRRASFGPEIGARLRRIVLTAVDGYDRREFRAFCRLATSVSDEGLRTALVERLGSANPRTVRHARWVLDALAAAEGRPQP